MEILDDYKNLQNILNIYITKYKYKVMTMNKYHDVGLCDVNFGVDKLLNKYKHDKDTIVSLLMQDPDKLIATVWQHDGPLAVDHECRCKMGDGDKRSPFSCSQCKNIGRIKNLGNNEPHFSIGCGSYIGKLLVVSTIDICKPFLNWDQEAFEKSLSYTYQYQKLAICGTNINNNINCISGDQFTIRTLIMWGLDKILMNKGLPHMLNLYTAFICNNKGHSITDKPDFSNLDDLAANGYLNITTAKSIITQLLASLLELNKVNFSHGNAGAHALVYMKEPVSYQYDRRYVEGPITLKIVDLWQSSATFSNIHYFSKDIKSDIDTFKSVFVPEIESSNCKSNYCKTATIPVYRLTNETVDIYRAMRHQGTPLFVGSFDFYCFMVSLMTHKKFRDVIMSDNKLYGLWTEMFQPDDLSYVERKIKICGCKTGSVNDNELAINIIRGVWLRCDIVNHLWEII